jgi:formyltetrahydrofolate-dependent phosphoribosylglycinamide formyltransferase
VKIAVLGSGGREHALAWRLGRDVGAGNIRVYPGNGGTPGATGTGATAAEVEELLAHDPPDLVVIGPEALLATGLADRLRARGLQVFGPGAAGARLETSKSWARAFMERHGVACPRSAIAPSPAAARGLLGGFPGGVVVKYEGLAAGKGVFVCADHDAAQAALDEIERLHGPAAGVVLEEPLAGPELSILGLTDGRQIRLLPPCQDHKQLLDGDRGPNTGGMGVVSPVPFCDAALLGRIEAEIVAPTLRGLGAEGVEVRGVIFFGVMLAADGSPRLLEYNARFGDPETEAILPALGGSLAALLAACARGDLGDLAPEIEPGFTVDVVLAAAGYPGAPRVGDPVEGLDDPAPNTLVFHAGTRRAADGSIVSAGGRVLNVVGRGPTLDEAIANAYRGVGRVTLAGGQFRRDIGRRGVRPLRAAVLVSGRGSNLGALLREERGGPLTGLLEIALVVSDRASAGGLEKARQSGVEAVALEPAGRKRPEYDAALAALLADRRIDLVILAGFMRILSEVVVDRFPGRIANIHPADTAQHQGLHGYQWALDQGLTETWVTVHLVDRGLDTGPVLEKRRVDLAGATTIEEVERRGLEVEHQVYAAALAGLCRRLGGQATGSDDRA